MKLINRIFGAFALTLFLATSCSTPKKITYMQGFDNGEVQAVKEQRRITVESDDALAIVVSSKDPELAEVFNLPVAQRLIGMTASGSSSNSVAGSYTVAPDGTINFPLLGVLRIGGLTRVEVAKLVENELMNRGLLKDAVVTVEFMNATISVLGDVAHPGEYTIDRDNLTILQALSKAGDLNITGLRDNVLVVREENGKDVAYRVDLTDTQNLMQSPAYYMQQNDVVYVEPNDTKKRQATVNGNTVLTPSFWLSVASLLTTISVLIFK